MKTDKCLSSYEEYIMHFKSCLAIKLVRLAKLENDEPRARLENGGKNASQNNRPRVAVLDINRVSGADLYHQLAQSGRIQIQAPRFCTVVADDVEPGSTFT